LARFEVIGLGLAHVDSGGDIQVPQPSEPGILRPERDRSSRLVARIPQGIADGCKLQLNFDSSETMKRRVQGRLAFVASYRLAYRFLRAASCGMTVG
jgi:hypothetical protein